MKTKQDFFEEFVDERVKITLKPNDLVLVGYIDTVFKDSIEFRTLTQTSYLTFDKITSITPIGRE